MTLLKHRLLSCWYCRNKRIASIIIAAAVALALTAPLVLLDKPESVSAVTVKKSSFNSVTLSWQKTDDTTKYQVYRADKPKGKYELVGETEKPRYCDRSSGLKTGKKYYYKVRAKNFIKSSEKDAEVAARPMLETPKVKADASKGEARIIIGTVPGAKSYDIYRDGKKIATEKAVKEEELSFIDKKAQSNKKYEYSVCAKRGGAESEASDEAALEIISAGDIQADLTTDGIKFSWEGDDAYTKYKLYNGEELLTETEETSFETDLKTGEYDLKLTGYGDGMKSPTETKRLEVSEGSLSSDEVIEAAIRWGTEIAEDNDFHYGRKSKGAQNLGCYFCGTNKPGKCKKRMPAAEMEKTWACCEFVTACFVHGGGVEDMSCMHNWIGTASNDNRYLKRSKNWKRLGHVSYSNLKRGDVILTKGHTVMYLGGGECLESHGGDDGKRGSKSWNWSIGVHSYPKGRYSGSATVWRYTGNGSGATGIVIREIEPENVTPDKNDTAQTRETAPEDAKNEP